MDILEYPTRDNSLIGAAGVHAVVSKLSLRGLIALPTIRNTAGVDIIAASKDGKWHANLQVKTSRSRVSFWPIGKHFAAWVGPNNFYVFVRYNKRLDEFEIFLESSEKVADNCATVIERDQLRGVKPWVPSFCPREGLEQLRGQWQQFGRNHVQPGTA